MPTTMGQAIAEYKSKILDRCLTSKSRTATSKKSDSCWLRVTSVPMVANCVGCRGKVTRQRSDF